MKKYFTTILFLSFLSTAYSQSILDYLRPGKELLQENKYIQNDCYHPYEYGTSCSPYCSHFAREKHKDELLNSFEYRNYDVLSYDLYMDWFDVLSREGTAKEDTQYDGVQKIVALITKDNVQSLEFDGPGLLIKSVLLDGKVIENFTQPDANGLININLPTIAKQGDTVSLELNYRFVAAYKNLGFHVYAKNSLGDYSPPYKVWSDVINDSIVVRDSIFLPERLAYTMSQPIYARVWMPCNDSPHDKAQVSITVKVPKGYNVAANGLLVDKITDADSETFIWKSESLMPTYLMSASASKYYEFSHWYKKISNPLDSIEVKYYVWDEDYFNDDTTGVLYNAPRTYFDVVNMMEFLAEKFIEYPYEKYGMVALQPFNYGGMEHQTITALNRLFLRNFDRNGRDIEYSSQSIIMHELAHQWLGNYITCATWSDIWINEGGAVWCEYLWIEHKFGEMYYKWSILGRRDFYLHYDEGIALPPVYGLPINNVFHTSLTYYKSSWVYHMLYASLGKEQFLDVLRSMLNKYGNKSLTTEDFKNHFKKEIPNSKIDFDVFFDQWIYKPGHPVFEMLVINNNDPGNNQVKVSLNQIQDYGDVPKVFNTLVVVEFYGPDSQRFFDTLYVNQREQLFELNLPFKPESAFIDTTYILCEVQQQSVTGIKKSDLAMENSLAVFPNPVLSGNYATIQISNHNAGQVSIDLYDQLGRKLINICNDFLSEGKHEYVFSTRNLPQGVYNIIASKNNESFHTIVSIVR